MLATPGLSAGSWVAPPRNAKSSATSGTVGSCTSQATMPVGLTMRSMVVASASYRRRRKRGRDERARP